MSYKSIENQLFSLLFQEEQRKPAQNNKKKAVEVFWSTRGSPGQLPRQLPDAFGSWPGSWPGEPKNNKKASKLLFFFVFPCVLHHLPEGKCCKYQGKTKKQKKKCLERSLVNLRLPGPAPQDSSRASSRAGSQAFGSWPGEPQNDQRASKLCFFLFFWFFLVFCIICRKGNDAKHQEKQKKQKKPKFGGLLVILGLPGLAPKGLGAGPGAKY